jgi:hypothetical protein
MGTYDGGQASVDSSSWKLSNGTSKNGEKHPDPAPRMQTESGMKRAVTPDPYASDNGDTKRNFGRQ